MELREPFAEGDVLHLPELGAGDDTFRVEEIFRGGMGLCAKVRHDDSGQAYALKTVLPSLLLRPDDLSRFDQEIRIWLRLSACDGVVEAHRVFRLNHIPVVCATWMEGGNLRRYMTSPEPEMVLRCMSRIVGTLEWCLSSESVTHRDLKPENILLDEALISFIGDWGLAGAISALGEAGTQADDPRLTRPGERFGTLQYAAPEQLIDASRADHRADIYSLGCIIHEWLNGSLPFSATTPELWLSEKLAFRSPRRGWLRRRSETLAEIAQRCLDPDPARRPQTYKSLNAAIAREAARTSTRFVAFVPELRYGVATGGRADFVARVRDGRLQSVIGDTGKYAVVEQEDIDAYLREAARCAGTGQLEKALEIYEMAFVPELVKEIPDVIRSQVVTVNYADCLMRLGRPREAIAVLQHLDRATDKPAEYFVNLSFAWIQLGDFESAHQVAAEGLERYADDKHLIGNLLIAQTALRRFDEALSTAEKRLALGREAESLQEVGSLYLEMALACPEQEMPKRRNLLDKASTLLKESKALNPHFNAARLNLARAYFERDDYESCTRELSEYARLPKDRGAAQVGSRLMAQCMFRVGLYKECLEFCDNWLAKFPDDVVLKRARAEAMVVGFCLGHENEKGVRLVEQTSLEFFETVVEEETAREPDDFIRLSQLRYWMGAPEESVAVLERALQLYGDNWRLLSQLGETLRMNSRLVEAHAILKKTADVAPWRAGVWSALADVCTALDRAEEAARALERAAAASASEG